MREVPRRSPLLQFSLLVLAFFGGAAAGLGLARALAPGSELASALSFFVLPATLILGFNAWLGLAILILLPRLIARLLRGPSPRTASGNRSVAIPPGEWAFLPVGSGLGLAAGVVVGLLSVSQPGWLVAGAYWLAGSAYGGALWSLARAGYLPFPDSS